MVGNAGLGSKIDEARVKEWVIVPSWRLRRGSRYCFLQITGDSMEPSLRRGDLVLVNLDRQDPTRLVGRLVASYIPNDG
jgi:phage repressor protein C with HTH and peptisase S24 domain